MKDIVKAIALTCVLGFPALAGEIPTGGFTSPPPPPPAPAPAATDGDMGGGGFAQQITDEIVLAIFGFYAR